MLEKILLPLDGSTLAESALPHALAMAEASGGSLILAHVLEQQQQPGQRGPVDPVGWHLRKAEAHAYLENILNQVHRAGGRGEAVVLEGTAANRIIAYAQEQPVDLIVLSSHGQSGLSGWNVSSVVQKILLRAYTSVLLVRAYRPNPAEENSLRYGRVLVPLDGSQRAEAVFPMLKTLLHQQEATALLVHVVAQPEMPRRVPLTAEERQLAERLVSRNHEEASRYLAQVNAHLNGSVETRVLVGESVIATLHDLAEREGIELVLLSAHGYTCSANHPYGSVGTSFIAYGNTPLLIVQDLDGPGRKAGVRELFAQNGSEARGRVALHEQSPG
jgi:nucleotide-binding universal stress UspA family protein